MYCLAYRTLFAIGTFNGVLLLVILYWLLFGNEAPPFINGRPLGDVVGCLMAGTAGPFVVGGIMVAEEG